MGPVWPGASERPAGLFSGQQPRPRAFSQSAVHTLEQRERERDLDKVRTGQTAAAEVLVLFSVFVSVFITSMKQEPELETRQNSHSLWCLVSVETVQH